MDDSDEAFRRQLTEAIANCRRQIDVDQTPDAMTNFENADGLQTGIAALRTELASLEATLAELDAKAATQGDAKPRLSALMADQLADSEYFNETHPDEEGVETADAEAPDATVAAVDAPPAPEETPGGRLRAVLMVGIAAAIVFGAINSVYFGRRGQWPEAVIGWLAAAIAIAVFSAIYGLSRVYRRRRLQDGFQGSSQPDIVA